MDGRHDLAGEGGNPYQREQLVNHRGRYRPDGRLDPASGEELVVGQAVDHSVRGLESALDPGPKS